MSKRIALLATLAILELSICSNASMSENSTNSDMPLNTESISDTAEAEQPAKLIDKSADGAKDEEDAEATKASGSLGVPEAVNKADLEPSAGASGKEPAAKSKVAAPTAKKYKAQAPKEDKEDEGDLDKQAKEQDANAFMAHDDSHPADKAVDPLLFYQAGCRYIQAKKFQLALDAFNKALELNPRYYEASAKKALVFQLVGMDKYAARRYQDILKFRDMDEVRINLATLHRKHKHYTGAEEQLRAVLQHNWASYEARYNLANTLLESGKHEEAMKEYKMCMKMKPRDPMVHNNMGVLFLQKNYPEEALLEFRKAAQLSPKNPTFVANINTVQKQIAEKKKKGATM